MALRIENAFGAKMDALLKMKTAYDRGAHGNGEVDITIERYVGKPCTSRPFLYSRRTLNRSISVGNYRWQAIWSMVILCHPVYMK
jgi:hypothetical protein